MAPADEGAAVLGGLVGIDHAGADHGDEGGDPDGASAVAVGVRGVPRRGQDGTALLLPWRSGRRSNSEGPLRLSRRQMQGEQGKSRLGPSPIHRELPTGAGPQERWPGG